MISFLENHTKLNYKLAKELKIPKCNVKCGKHTWNEVIFIDIPIWLVLVMPGEQPAKASYYNDKKETFFSASLKYKLLCMYDFEKLTNVDHFRGVFLLNSNII